jgi:hypothetical protein
MKKFIFTANVIAVIMLVPTVLFSYLHKTETPETKKASVETVSEPAAGRTATSIFGLVKSF